MNNKGQIPWNKGKTNVYSQPTLEKMRQAKLGTVGYWLGKQRPEIQGWGFTTKGMQHTEEWKQNMSETQKRIGNRPPIIRGELHHLWKGSKVSYDGLHKWIARQLGKPTKCEHCLKDGLIGKHIHWANKSQQYLRNVTDWLRLCASCHKKYDLTFNGDPNR